MCKLAKLFICLIFIQFPSVFAGNNSLKLGIFPHMPPSKLQKTYAPIAGSFSKSLGVDVKFSTMATYEKFMAELRKEAYDIVFVQPFDYIWAHDSHNYEPIARRGEPLTAILIVRKDSDIKSVRQLKGKTIANPPAVAAVSYLTTAGLVKNQLRSKRIYTRNHFACMQHVLIGKAHACGTARRALKYFKQKNLDSRFRIVYETDKIPHALFAVHKRVGDKQKQKIRETILGWSQNDSGREMLKKSNFVKSFIAVKDDEYNIVRDMAKSQ